MKLNSVFISICLLISFSSSYCQNHEDHANIISQSIEKDKDRWLWQLPRKVINEIGIREGMVVADVGAGEGYFTIPIARAVGMNGIIYASDIDSYALQKLKDKAINLGLSNVQLIKGDENNPKLPEGKIDIVIVVNTIHLIENLNSVFEYINASLKNEGKLVIIQWDAEKMEIESEKEWDSEDKNNFTLRSTLRRIYQAGFEVERILTFLPMQNIFICVPQESK